MTTYAAKKAWTKFDSATGTLTFYYTDKGDLGDDEFDLLAEVSGGVPLWNQKYRDNITKVVFNPSFADARPTNCRWWFFSCQNLTSIEGLKYLNTSSATDMSYMFLSSSKLTSLDLSTFDTSNVTAMSYMFNGCSLLNSLNLSSFNTCKVKSMEAMFKDCSALTSLKLSNFDTQNVTTMSSMFSGCSNLKELFLPDFDTKKVTTMYSMFENCSSLQSLDLTKFNTQKVKDMSFMFFGCSSLKALDVSMFDTQNVTSMIVMFSNCENITSLDLSNFDTQKVTNFNAMFRGCSALTTIYTSDKFAVNETATGVEMFTDCKKLMGDVVFDNSNVDIAYAKRDGGYFSDKVYTRMWVKYDDGTLNFKHGYKPTFGENEYPLNEGNDLPEWVEENANVKQLVFDNTIIVARPTSCSYWFYNCDKLTSGNIVGLNYLNTSEVTTFRYMFGNCSELTQLNLSYFDPSNATDMSYMFYGCSQLQQIYASIDFNTDNVTTDENMFAGCTKLKGLVDFDPNVVDKTYANVNNGYFLDNNVVCPWVKFNKGVLTFMYGYKKSWDDGEYKLDPEQWNSVTESVTKAVFDKSFANVRPTTCASWFKDCKNMTTIEGIEYLKTSDVTDMSSMFEYCSSLVSLDVSKFDTHNVEKMGNMFLQCSSLTSLDLLGFDTRKTWDMTSMFAKCSNLTSLDLSNFDTQNAGSLWSMFNSCSNLSTIYASDAFKVVWPCNTNYMFDGCYKLKGDIDYRADKVDGTYATTDDGYFLSKAYIQPWTKFAEGVLTFQYGYKKKFGDKEYNLTPDSWNDIRNDVEKVVFDASFAETRPTTCASWFKDCNNMTAIEGIEYLNTEDVTNMNSMFYNCQNLTSLDVSKFNTQKVTDMSYMFFNCQNLTSLDVSKFNTQKVTDMGYMFYNCQNLTSLDVSIFNTQEVTDMGNMFYNCSKFESIDVSKFETNNVQEMSYMFSGCTELSSLDLSNFNTIAVQNMISMFGNCTNLKSIYFGANFKPINASCFNNVSATMYCSPANYYKFDMSQSESTVKAYVDINPAAEYGTLCVPIGSTLAESSYSGFDKLYTIKSVDKDKGTITMEEATEIEPGVAYVYHRNLPEGDTESIITFSADMEESSAVTAPKNESSLQKGTFERITAPGGCYILQTDGNFHPVSADNSTLGVGAYRAYLDLSSLPGFDNTGDVEAKGYKMVFEDNQTTAIDGVSEQPNNQPKTYFDLMGRRVSTPKAGGLYIVNGKKVMYKN